MLRLLGSARAWLIILVLAWTIPGCGRDSTPAGGAASSQGAGGTTAGVQNGAGEARSVAPPVFVPALNPVPPSNRSLVRVSEAMGIRSEAAVFAKPAVVMLKLDRSKLPGNVKETDFVAVLAVGGLTERLRTPVKWDAAAGTVSYELTRRYPLVAAEGEADGSGVETYVVIRNQPAFAISDSTEPLFYAGEAHKEDAKPLVAKVKQSLEKIRRGYEALGFKRVEPITVEMTDLYNPPTSNAVGAASGGNLIELDIPTLKSGADIDWLLAHEYFHMIQQTYVLQALTRSLGDPSALTPMDSRWVDEGTADAFEALEEKQPPARALVRLKLNYGYEPLNLYENGGGDHQYQASALWLYTAARYGDLRPVVEEYFSKVVEKQGEVDLKVADEGTESLEAILSRVDEAPAYGEATFRTMDNALRGHFRKSLRRVYLESLLELYVKKDVEPFATGARNVFGGPGELRTPLEKLVIMMCSSGGTQATGSMEGEPMCIAKAVEVARQDEAKGAALELTLTCDGKADPDDLVMVAFPVGADKKVRKQSAGNLARAAVVTEWPDVPQVMVWVVNMSLTKHTGIRLHARVKMGSDVHIAYAETPGSKPTEGNKIAVTSSALGGLGANDVVNGVRLKLYRSTSASGEFRAVTSTFLDENVSADIFKGDANSKPYMTGTDTAVLSDMNVYRRGQPVETGPFWYRVGQTLIVKQGDAVRAEGDEVLSNVLPPGGGKIVLIPEEGSKEPWHVEGNSWAVTTAALTMGTQNWDAQGAEFVVTCGNWKGHFYSGRAEGGRTFGMMMPGNEAAGSRVRLRVPYRPNGPEVTITAMGQGVSGTLKVNLPADAKGVAKEAQLLSDCDKGKAEDLNNHLEEVKKLEKELADAEAANTQRADAKKKNAVVFGTLMEGKREVMYRQMDLKHERSVLIPFVAVEPYLQLRHYYDTADPEWDLKMLGQWAKRADAEHAWQVESDKAYVAMLTEVMNDPEEKSNGGKWRADLAVANKRVTDIEATPSGSDHTAVVMKTPAEMAGRVDFVRGAYQQMLTEIDESVKSGELDANSAKQNRAGVLRNEAESLVMLTGDRAEGAKLWRQADELAGLKPEDKSRRDMPGWWPVGQ